MSNISSVRKKAMVLSNGIQVSDEVLANYGHPYLVKRRGYGNQDPLRLRHAILPQEVYINLGPDQLVAAVNVTDGSDCILEFEDGKYYLLDSEGDRSEVGFPMKPDFYDELISNRRRVSQIISLYGGASLGIFAYGMCDLVKRGMPCHYCSISQNRDRGTDFDMVVKEDVVAEALRTALNDVSVKVNQVMLNGGNFPDRDKNFRYYVKLARRIERLIDELSAGVEAHLIVFPPEDLDLIEELEGANISIAINTEVYDPDLFSKYCPGKSAVCGREKIFAALEKSVEVLGKGRVFSILVGGLEPIKSLDEGLNYLASRGITPVINVLHTDPETPLEDFPNPSVEMIMEMGSCLQGVYDRNGLEPFYWNCGRNSIDTEAYKKMFIS